MEALRHVRLSPRGAAEGTFAGPHKSHYRGTAALGYLVIREGDEVGLSLADVALHQHVPPGASFTHLNRVLAALGDARAEGRTDLGACLEQVHRRTKRRGVLAILTDCLDAGE